MNQRTEQKLRELESYPWFANAGDPVDSNYLPVKNWQEAVELSAGAVWSSVQLQTKNNIADEVTRRDYYRSEEWNGIAAELRKQIALIVANSVEPVAKKFELGLDFQGSVSWDMLGICMETEFSDLLVPMFFVPCLQPIY